MKFKNKKTNEVKDAYSINSSNEKVLIQFSKGGKTYSYSKDNIEILGIAEEQENIQSLKIYELAKDCYRCHKITPIYTYIVFNDGTNESLLFPWDKKRLLRNQDIFSHLSDPSIEYYGLSVIGDDKNLDKQIMSEFPDNIKSVYSKTKNKEYPMNICCHCGAGQGWYFVFRIVNEKINKMEKIPLVSK